MQPPKESLTIATLKFLSSNTALVLVVLLLIGVGACTWDKILALVGISPHEPVPSREPTGPPAPSGSPAPSALFEEYPIVAADREAHPDETRDAVWVTFRHLPPKARPQWIARWNATPKFTPVGIETGVYRFPCQGDLARDYSELVAEYPYAIAPGQKTEKGLSDAYRAVTDPSRFTEPRVVRGDWLFLAGSGKASFAAGAKLRVTPVERERLLDEPLDVSATFGSPAPEVAHFLKAEAPLGPTRRWLEAHDGWGSNFARCAGGLKLGIPVVHN